MTQMMVQHAFAAGEGRHYRIPVIDPDAYAGSYAGIAFDANDPRHREPLVPLESAGIAYESHHARTDGGNWPYHRPIAGARKDMWLRRTAAAMLARVNARLRPYGAELFVLDGYRSVACQQGLWEFYVAQAARAMPDAGAQEWDAYARDHVVDPTGFAVDDPRTWPAHATGASVDLTLRDLDSGARRDMGVRFEDICAAGTNDHFERERDAGRIGAGDARLWNRRLIHWAMSGEGFVNDPFVFWHYDWGNQLYVKLRRALHGDALDAAWYGYIDPPPAK
jgi:D-alanyl-D-alanine dipeptidase